MFENLRLSVARLVCPQLKELNDSVAAQYWKAATRKYQTSLILTSIAFHFTSLHFTTHRDIHALMSNPETKVIGIAIFVCALLFFPIGFYFVFKDILREEISRSISHSNDLHGSKAETTE